MAIEIRAIKFYPNKNIKQIDYDKAIIFLKECQEVENKLLEYHWNKYDKFVLDTWITFYKNRIMINSPPTKFQHYMQILHLSYMQLKSIQEKIIKKIHFKLDDKTRQRVYNYCSKFCFNWDGLVKYINKQIKSFKKKDKKYYDFLTEVKKVIDNEQSFLILKQDIEDEFWKIKNSYNMPIKKQFQIHLNDAHTIDINKSENEWEFVIDTNTFISAHNMEKFKIPVTISEYHKKALYNKDLKHTFNLRINEYDKIEIIGAYEIEVNYTVHKPIDIIGIDIGLKKLLFSSDGEVVLQNKNIVKKVKQLIKNQSNRQSLEAHLKKKLDDENFTLPDKNYMKKQNKLSRFVQCDNRYKIKQFLRSREDTHIIMEDLHLNDAKTYSKEVNYMLRRMKIQGIKNDILKYTKEMGIKTTQVNPRYTSVDCPICDNRDKLNRQTQETFKCTKCGHTDNADHNASINIMNRYLKVI